MKRNGAILAGVAAATLLASGAVVASAIQDAPQDARPTPSQTTADLNRQSAGQGTPPPAPAEEPAPAGTPAPASPVPLTPPDGAARVAEKAAEVEKEAEEEEAEKDDEKAAKQEEKAKAPEAPGKRPRRRVVLVQAIDKITAQRMTFEVPVDGRPVRFARALIFEAKACEVSTAEEPERDAIAYLRVTLQPRGAIQQEPRQIFRGWMFASSPAVNGLRHPVYDAWVVGCK